ncbi:hypothetical protein B0T25DRAFT_556032 [Lasiosphaeria hispida]|uniref:Uncharacterized protein n=1 Tax=Lasiosphaeria hispida TaxID=260671 RepID=A0AAJ0H949_9PEZI|nr:hypothetical protein B0T25DRAFT_556032 [Lasiosphaeria hispida]
MASTSSIPRFLLPQSGQIWRGVTGTAIKTTSSRSTAGRTSLRSASTNTSPTAKPAASGPRVLEKPERFNPPSHGARLPRKTGAPSRHFGGELSETDLKSQARKDYPGLEPPKGSWAQRILYSRWIHMAITLGTLGTLAVFTATENFKRNSPFADMLPAVGDFVRHPIDSTRALLEVIKLDELHTSAQVAARRQRHVDDVAKREVYRKAHGLNQEQGFASMFGLGNKKEVVEVVPVAGDAGVVPADVGEVAAPEQKQEPRKKILGIF